MYLYFKKNCQNVFQSCAILHFEQQYIRVPVASLSHQYLVGTPAKVTYSSKKVVIPHCGFYVDFSNDIILSVLSCTYLPTVFVKCLLKTIANFFLLLLNFRESFIHYRSIVFLRYEICRYFSQSVFCLKVAFEGKILNFTDVQLFISLSVLSKKSLPNSDYKNYFLHF